MCFVLPSVSNVDAFNAPARRAAHSASAAATAAAAAHAQAAAAAAATDAACVRRFIARGMMAVGRLAAEAAFAHGPRNSRVGAGRLMQMWPHLRSEKRTLRASVRTKC